MLWHYHIWHPNFMYLERILLSLFNKNSNLFKCEVCESAKHTKSHYDIQPYKSSYHFFFFIHSDVWGGSWVNNVTRTKWFVTFIDDHTRITWVLLVKEKSEVRKIFENLHKLFQNQYQTNITNIQVLRTENGGEYSHHSLGTYFLNHGIMHQISCKLPLSKMKLLKERILFYVVKVLLDYNF